jgi:hypothetical protein
MNGDVNSGRDFLDGKREGTCSSYVLTYIPTYHMVVIRRAVRLCNVRSISGENRATRRHMEN